MASTSVSTSTKSVPTSPSTARPSKLACTSTSTTAEAHLASFRNSYNPRIAVTVDMIATGTDVRPIECILFLRSVKSRNLFEQMKGRGSRIIRPDDLRAVTPDASSKTHFVIVDAVGVCESELVDTHPLEKKTQRLLRKAPGSRILR